MAAPPPVDVMMLTTICTTALIGRLSRTITEGTCYLRIPLVDINCRSSLHFTNMGSKIYQMKWNDRDCIQYRTDLFFLTIHRCPQYPDLPAGCTKTADLNDPCCLVPVCSTPKPTPYNPMYPTTTPAPNQPTTPYNPYVTPLPKGEIVGYNPTTQNPYNPSPKPSK